MPEGQFQTGHALFESFRQSFPNFQSSVTVDSLLRNVCTAATPRSNQGTISRDGNDLAMKRAYVYAAAHQGKE